MRQSFALKFRARLPVSPVLSHVAQQWFLRRRGEHTIDCLIWNCRHLPVTGHIETSSGPLEDHALLLIYTHIAWAHDERC